MGNYYAGIMNASVDSSLKHFGILGQKWGVRRFQNPDGSLTPAGRERYGYSKASERVAKKGIREQHLIEDHTIPKGTVLYRSSTNPEDSPNGASYFTYYDVDRSLYKSGYLEKRDRKKKILRNVI